jgi:hypothetical protein
MMIAIIVVSVLAALAGAVILSLRIPEAHAWDPQSHDRHTCSALDLLRSAENPTLLGWVLKRIPDNQSRAARHTIWQVRRGSIDEDMNSDLINAFQTMRDAGIEWKTYYRWKYAALMKVARILFSSVDSVLEGANGAYHFYNPVRNVGLSEPMFVSNMIREYGADVTRPMTSARSRAFDRLPKALFDHEDRNYTYSDAETYFRMGQSHLGFYALGRFAHLLQDMAVPAHVRDDSHFGIPNIEAKDPLEGWAGPRDWPGSAEASSSEKWGFDPGRSFEGLANYNEFLKLAGDELGHLIGEKGRGAEGESIFGELARWAHRTYYSYGTIPGNADSHNPDDTDQSPFPRRGTPWDQFWARCEPNEEALWAMFSMYGNHGRILYDNWPMAITRNDGPNKLPAEILEICQKPGKVGADIIAVLKKLPPIYADINNIDAMRLFDSSGLQYLNRVRVGIEVQEQTADIGSHSPQIWQIHRCWWLEAFERMREPLLQESTSLLKLAEQNPGADAYQIFKQWIEQEDETKQVNVFIGFNAPCYLSEKKIREQYLATCPRSIAYSTLAICNWFEHQYGPDKQRGLGLWLNINGQPGQRPEVFRKTDDGEIPMGPGSAPVVKSKENLVTLGINNHVPANLDLRLEITLEEKGTDEDLFRDGVLLKTLLLRPDTSKDSGEIALEKDDIKKDLLLRDCPPFNMSFMEKAPLPPGRGGIKRDAESLLKVLNLTPGQVPPSSAGGVDEFDASFWTIEFDLLKPPAEEE